MSSRVLLHPHHIHGQHSLLLVPYRILTITSSSASNGQGHGDVTSCILSLVSNLREGSVIVPLPLAGHRNGFSSECDGGYSPLLSASMASLGRHHWLQMPFPDARAAH